MEPIELEEKARVLVADDAVPTVELMQAALTLAGYEVVIASDGEQALEKAQQESFDLILIDVVVPKLNGYEVCARLKGNDRTRLIPVVLIVPGQTLEEKIRGIEIGADDFLQRPINRVELLARVRSLVRTKRLNDELITLENTIMALARSVEARDPYTEGHIERVVTYALILGQEIGLSQRAQQMLRKGAILHDAGKVGVRDSVLLKPGPLSEEEFEEIKMHPTVGERICQPLGVSSILEIVRHHHEAYDGHGYPDGLAGQDIPQSARIMALVDAYDALTSDRPHRGRLSQEGALAVLRGEAGKQFDPVLVLTFIELAGKGYLGQ